MHARSSGITLELMGEAVQALKHELNAVLTDPPGELPMLQTLRGFLGGVSESTNTRPFQVGDRVRVLNCLEEDKPGALGLVGVLNEIDRNDSRLPWRVEFPLGSGVSMGFTWASAIEHA